jgi:transcription elongation factor Elf1
MQNVSILDEDIYMEQANEDGLWEPFCPYCGDESGARVEPDAYYTVLCNSCGKKFKVEGL